MTDVPVVRSVVPVRSTEHEDEFLVVLEAARLDVGFAKVADDGWANYLVGHLPACELIEATLTFHDAKQSGAFLPLTGGTLSGALDMGGQAITNVGTMTTNGDINLGGNDITSVGLVDGVDVSAHASRHARLGGDQIDGDRLDIDWNPTNYTPTTAPTEVTSADELTAHLAGIDGDMLLHDGSVSMSGALDMGTNAITNVGNVDGVDVSAHKTRHQNGGADEIAVTELTGQDWQIVVSNVDAAAARTTINLQLGVVSTTTVGVSVEHAITLRRVAVTALHFDAASPPATWTLRVRKNGATGADVATFTFNWNASSGTEEVTTGNLSSTVAVAVGDRLHFLADGSSIDTIALQVTVFGTRD